jgi:hypothetical protein
MWFRKKRKYRYFVFFVFTDGDKSGYGHVVMTLNNKIITGEYLTAIEQWVKNDKNLTTVTITNFIFIEEQHG